MQQLEREAHAEARDVRRHVPESAFALPGAEVDHGGGRVGADPGIDHAGQLVLELAAADDPTLARDVRQAVEAVGGVVDCRVNVQAVKAAPAPPPPVAATGRALPVMHEPAAAQRAAPAPTPAAFPSLGKIIAVSSGKGGVGKSTVTVNLAAALAARGFTVGILDADIWGFSVPRMLGLGSRLGGHDGKIDPNELAVGAGRLRVVSMGFLVEDEGSALMWRGLILAKALEQFLTDVRWGSSTTCSSTCLPVPATCRWAWPGSCHRPRCSSSRPPLARPSRL